MRRLFITTLFASCFVGGASAQEWSREVLDGGTLPNSTGSPVWLELDSNDLPRIAYSAGFNTNHDFRYAYHDGTQWHIGDVFDPGSGSNVGAWVSMDLDQQDRPHIAYQLRYDSTTAFLKYAWHDGAQWQVTTIFEDQHVFYPSLELDSEDRPHIAYYSSAPARDLRYTVLTDTGWEWESVDTAGWVGYDCDLALDSQDRPHIAYRYGGSPFYLKYAVKDGGGGGWNIQAADANTPIGYGISITLDDQDQPHISHTSNFFRLLYTFMDGEGWHTQDLADATRASQTSIVLDSADRPHIGYSYSIDEEGPQDHMYTYFNGADWVTTRIERGYGMGMMRSIALTSDDQPRVAYGRRQDLYNAYLVYAEGQISCAADFNGDGVVNTLDFLDFLNAYSAGDSSADFNGDGVVNTLDFLAFLNAYNAGC